MNNNNFVLLPFPSNYLSCISKGIHCIGPNSSHFCNYISPPTGRFGKQKYILARINNEVM